MAAFSRGYGRVVDGREERGYQDSDEDALLPNPFYVGEEVILRGGSFL